MYSQNVLRLIQELPKRGSCQDFTHLGKAQNPVCGDVTQFQLRIQGDVVRECRFQTYGCVEALGQALKQFVPKSSSPSGSR